MQLKHLRIHKIVSQSD